MMFSHTFKPTGTQFPKTPRFIHLDGTPLKEDWLTKLRASTSTTATLVMGTTALISYACAGGGAIGVISAGLCAGIIPMLRRDLQKAQEIQNHHLFGCNWQNKIIDKAPETDTRNIQPRDLQCAHMAAMNSYMISTMNKFNGALRIGVGGVISIGTTLVTSEPSAIGVSIMAPLIGYSFARASHQKTCSKRYANVALGEWDLISDSEAKSKQHLADVHARAANNQKWSWSPSPQPAGAGAMIEAPQEQMKLAV